MQWKNCCMCRPRASRRRRAWTAPWCACCRTRSLPPCPRRCSNNWCSWPSTTRANYCPPPPGRWLDAPRSAGRFDTRRRAEEVPVQEYLDLAREAHRWIADGKDPPCAGASWLSCSAEPVIGVEGAAHAQRIRGHIDELVGGHFLGRFGIDCRARDRRGAVRLVRPFCLAGGCRTGYRKE